MKKYLIFLPAVLAFALVANTSQAQDNPLFRHISPDANSAYHINLPVILSKVSLTDLFARIPAPKHGNDKSQEIMKFLQDPNWTGVNINQDILVTSSIPDLLDSPSYTTIILHLADSSKFRISIRKQSQGLRVTRHPDKSFSAYKDKMALAWNNELAVIVITNPALKDALATAAAMGKMGDSKKEPGTTQAPPTPKYGALAVPRALATLKGWDSSPITDDPEFRTAFSDNSDLQMYAKKSNYFKAIAKILPHGLLGNITLDSLNMYEHSITTLRFENGRMVMQSTTEMLPHIVADLEKYPPPPANANLLAGLPKDQTLLGFINLRINLRVIGYLLNRIGIQRKLDSSLAAQHLSLDDFYRAFSGDILVAAVMPTHTDSFQRPKPNVYSVISVNDPVALGKITATFKTDKSPAGDDSTGKKPSKLDKFKDNYVLKNNLLVFSDSRASAEGYFTSTEKRGNDALTDAIKDNPTYLWIDLQTVINAMLGPVQSDAGADPKMKFMNGLHKLDKLIVRKGGLHDGKVSSSFEISVTNKDQNILKTIIDLIPESKH